MSRCPPFFSCGCSKPFGTPCFGVLSLRIEKWALECSCVPKGVGATFCSKTGPFFSCACSKASRVPVCPRRPKPHSAAKQGRSFRVAALNWVLSLRIEKWTLECSCVPKGAGATFCSKTGLFFSCGPCVPKAAWATFCSKTEQFFSCGCSKLCFALHKLGKNMVDFAGAF